MRKFTRKITFAILNSKFTHTFLFMKRKLFIILSSSFCSVFILLGILGYVAYDRLFSPAFNIAGSTRLYIDVDDTIDSVRFKVNNVLSPKSIDVFDWLVKHEKYNKVKTGSYLFEPNDDWRIAIRRLKLGWQTPVRIVVPSVRTINHMAQSLGKQLMVNEQEIIDTLSSPSFMTRMGYTAEILPTLFVPNTYEVYWNISVEELMQRLSKEYNSYWNNERREKATAQGLTPIEVATLASIVDEETSVNSEKPIIAGLYLNRLHRGILLQADPTVKFATGDPTLRRILNKHLTIDSPYNTYIYKGLPPGPIRIPSMAALEAVLNPAKHNYLYMCAKEDFSGTHNFASTLTQHNVNARRYQQALNQRGIK